jgi:uncharacterized membrane protein YedE/YeeE
MDPAMNAAYERNKVPKEPAVAVTILGYRVPGEKVWIVTSILLGVLIFLVTIVVFILPSGIPYLAAKNADGYVGYVAYFFMYMFGFFFTLLVFFSILVALAAWSGRKIPFLG